MQLVIDKSFLQTATSRLTGAISERGLANIFLQVTDRAEISASDMMFSVVSYFDSEVIQKGRCFVPAKLFCDIVKELPNGQVKILTDTNFMTLIGGALDEFQMKIPLIDEVTAHEPAKYTPTQTSSLLADQLNYMIEQVQFSIQQNSTRNFGTVVKFHAPKPKLLRMVGCDGFRLSYCEVAGEELPKFLKEGVCLSKRCLQELARMGHEGFEQINISISEDKTTLIAQVPDYSIYMRLSSIDYPAYEKVFPEIKTEGVKFSRSYMLGAVRRVLLASDKNNALSFEFEPNRLTVKSRNMGKFEGKEVIALDDYNAGNTAISVNGKYVIEILNAMKSDEFKLYFVNSETPVLIKPVEEPKSCDSLHVLVPIEDSAQA